jgi:hypothetical protein
MVGAGTGALAVLAGEHQRVTLYEIDPEVVWIAEESGFFTYLANARAEHEWVIGDGRIALQSAGTALRPHRAGRVLLRHDPAPPDDARGVRALPRAARARGRPPLPHHESTPGPGARARGARARLRARCGGVGRRAARRRRRAWHLPSHWVLLAPPHESLTWVPPGGWRPLGMPQDTRAWTDDFSDLLSVQRWN